MTGVQLIPAGGACLLVLLVRVVLLVSTRDLFEIDCKLFRGTSTAHVHWRLQQPTQTGQTVNTQETIIQFVKDAMEAQGMEWTEGRAVGANIFIDPGRGDLYIQVGFDNDTRLCLQSSGKALKRMPGSEEWVPA